LRKTAYNVNIKFLKNYNSFKPGDTIEFYLEHDGELITYNDLREDSKSGYIIKVFVDDSTESLNINHNEGNDYLFNVKIPETDFIFSNYNLLQIIVEYAMFYEGRNA
jgi:hypothetical protein